MEKVLGRFNVVDAKPLGVPLEPHVRFSMIVPTHDDATNYMKNVLHSSTCGSFTYAMVATWIDIAHVVGVVSMFMANSSRAHWEAIESILRYLNGTKGESLCSGKGPFELKGFCDSDMAGDVDTRCHEDPSLCADRKAEPPGSWTGRIRSLR